MHVCVKILIIYMLKDSILWLLAGYTELLNAPNGGLSDHFSWNKLKRNN